MPAVIRHLFFYTVVSLLAVIVFFQHKAVEEKYSLALNPVATAKTVALTQPAEFSRSFVSRNEKVSSVHASAIVSLPENKLLTVWYGGTREGSRDVEIYASHKDVDTDWQPAVSIMTRDKLSRDTGRYIRKLGNPVLLADEQGVVWMFFVSVSIGGWSTSALNLVISKDAGYTWGKARRIQTSPFLNLSTLVKGRPFFFRDGTIGLPAYHELAGKFAELIHVTAEGDVLGKSRLTHNRMAIQPSIVQIDDYRLLALMRNTNQIRKIVRSYSSPAGNLAVDDRNQINWEKAEYIELPNPDAAISVLSDGENLVLAYNNLSNDRNKLALAVSRDDGKNWIFHTQLESSGPLEDGLKSEFSYPYFILSDDGYYHLVYTWQRKRIAYIRFNKAWLEKNRE